MPPASLPPDALRSDIGSCGLGRRYGHLKFTSVDQCVHRQSYGFDVELSSKKSLSTKQPSPLPSRPQSRPEPGKRFLSGLGDFLFCAPKKKLRHEQNAHHDRSEARIPGAGDGGLSGEPDTPLAPQDDVVEMQYVQ